MTALKAACTEVTEKPHALVTQHSFKATCPHIHDTAFGGGRRGSKFPVDPFPIVAVSIQTLCPATETRLSIKDMTQRHRVPGFSGFSLRDRPKGLGTWRC